MSEQDDSAEDATALRSSAPAPSALREQPRFTPGLMLADRYRIIALLGRGGMGEVYRAEDIKLGQQVALKFLPPNLAGNPERLQALYAELRLGRQVSHPNVCRLYDVFEWEGGHFISMEYIDGEDLASLLRRIGRLPHDKALDIARDLCSGLAAAHAIGIVHRDLKPANVMIDGRGNARITDFGLAAFTLDLAGSTPIAGTPSYMAPEQLSGGEITTRTDLYAVGLILYEMFTGKRLFEASSIGEIIAQHRTPHSHSISQTTREIDPAVQRVMLRCLEEKPEDRPPSIHAVIHALPGGDPLQAAIDAGETPSPEMIAASEIVGDTRPAIAWGLLLLALIALLLAAALASKAKLYNRVSLPLEPAVLAHRATELLERFGYDPRGGDVSYYLNWDDDYFRHSARHGLDENIDAVRPSPVVFRFRTSPVELIPLQKERLINHENPPFIVPGMARIGLDPRGALLYFGAVPPGRLDDPATPREPVDWTPFFEAAGIDSASAEPVTPVWSAPADSHARFAWNGRFAEGDGIHIEAASYGGKPVWFALIPEWRTPFVPEPARRGTLLKTLGALNVTMIVVLILLSLALARRNWRRGRGDRRGALRLGLFVGVTFFAARWFRAHHSLDPGAEWELIEQLLSEALYTGMATWIVYLALEPYVRRRWPRTLIGWTRVLAGRFRDPLVGREVLVGVVTGAFAAVLIQGSVILPRLIGMPELNPVRQFFTALSDRSQIVTIILRDVNLATAGAVILGVFFLLLQLALRKEALMKGVAVVLLTFMMLGQGMPFQATETIIIEIFVVLVFALLIVTVFFRFGLLSLAVLLFVFQVLFDVPTTLDPSHWYFGRSAFVLSLLALLAAAAFRMTLASQPIFRGLLMEDEA